MQLFDNIINLKMKYYEKMNKGEVLASLENDIEKITEVCVNRFLGVVIDIISVVAVLVITLYMSWKLTIVVLVTSPIGVLFFLFIGCIVNKNQKIIRDNLDIYYGYVQEYVADLQELKVLNAKSKVVKRIEKILLMTKEYSIKSGKATSLGIAMVGFLNFFSLIIVYLIGIYLISRGELSVEFFIAFSAYAATLSESLIGLFHLNTNLQEAFVSIDRVMHLLSTTEKEKEEWGERDSSRPLCKIEIKDLHYSYDEKKVIDGLNLKINSNGYYTFVGKNGCGKSTLLKMLCRLYIPDNGCILLNDVNYDQYTEQTIRKNIIVDSQENILFNMTLRENLTLGLENEDLDKANSVSDELDVKEWIENLPEKYETLVSTNGSNYSGGQKQKIKIFRTLMGEGSIILLDEPYSAMDNVSTKKYRDELKRISKKNIVITISHSIEDAKCADSVFVMDKGMIIASGTHEELIDSCRGYKEIWG